MLFVAFLIFHFIFPFFPRHTHFKIPDDCKLYFPLQIVCYKYREKNAITTLGKICFQVFLKQKPFVKEHVEQLQSERVKRRSQKIKLFEKIYQS